MSEALLEKLFGEHSKNHTSEPNNRLHDIIKKRYMEKSWKTDRIKEITSIVNVTLAAAASRDKNTELLLNDKITNRMVLFKNLSNYLGDTILPQKTTGRRAKAKRGGGGPSGEVNKKINDLVELVIPSKLTALGRVKGKILSSVIRSKINYDEYIKNPTTTIYAYIQAKYS